MVKQAHTNITVLAAAFTSGKILYSLVKGSNTGETYAIFLQDLADRLDEESPGWRANSIII